MGKILYAEQDGIHVLKFVGDVRVTLGPTIGGFLTQLGECEDFKSIVIDLTETEGIDSTSLGLLAKISIKTKDAFKSVPTIISPNEDITRILVSMGFNQVFVIVKELVTECGQLDEISAEIVSESSLREQVIEAHKVLMSLNEHNREEFRDLVEALESELESERHGGAALPRNRVA